MDLVRSRAIPALIAALAAPALASADDCPGLEGTYRYQSAAQAGQEPRKLSELTLGPGNNKLFRVDKPGSKAGLFDQKGPIQRPKTTLLASTVAVTHSAGGTRLRFMDAAGATLAEMGIDVPARWTCKSSLLERRSERTEGLGNAIRTEKIEETLSRTEAGDLFYLETVTVIDPPGTKPLRREARFPRVR